MLTDISPSHCLHLILHNEPPDQRHRKLMQIADQLNKRFGDNTVFFN